MKALVVDLENGSSQSPTRPPTFAECYVCHKQFGSHSIALHEPKCLEKWRAANGALPLGRRAATPVRLEALPVRRTPQPAASIASLTSSWPSSNGLLKAALAAGPTGPSGSSRRLRVPSGGRAARPQTTTLSRPKVLAAEHADQLDMSTRRCSELLALTSLSGSDRQRDSPSSSSGGSSSSSDSSSSSSSSVSSSSSPVSEAASDSSGSRAARPGTIRLGVGRRELNVPNIERRARTAVLSSSRSDSHSRSPPGVPRRRDGMPTPCVTCGKPENPERFHSHPEEGQREPARAAPRRLIRKRHSIQRPVPVRFHPQPALDPATKRKQQQRDKKRVQQRLQQEEEAEQRVREQQQQRHLTETLERYGRPAAGPTFVVCYVCGRQFGASSLPIHQPQCLEVRRVPPRGVHGSKMLSVQRPAEWGAVGAGSGRVGYYPCRVQQSGGTVGGGSSRVGNCRCRVQQSGGLSVQGPAEWGTAGAGSSRVGDYPCRVQQSGELSVQGPAEWGSVCAGFSRVGTVGAGSNRVGYCRCRVQQSEGLSVQGTAEWGTVGAGYSRVGDCWWRVQQSGELSVQGPAEWETVGGGSSRVGTTVDAGSSRVGTTVDVGFGRVGTTVGAGSGRVGTTVGAGSGRVGTTVDAGSGRVGTTVGAGSGRVGTTVDAGSGRVGTTVDAWKFVYTYMDIFIFSSGT